MFFLFVFKVLVKFLIATNSTRDLISKHNCLNLCGKMIAPVNDFSGVFLCNIYTLFTQLLFVYSSFYLLDFFCCLNIIQHAGVKLGLMCYYIKS